MKPINIEKLMNHSVGISDSYYRATENDLLEDYLKVADFLTISNEKQNITQDNLRLQAYRDEINKKLKELEPLLALKDTLIRQGLLKLS